MTKEEFIKWLKKEDLNIVAKYVEQDHFSGISYFIKLFHKDKQFETVRNNLINYLRQRKLSQSCFNES